MRFVTLICFLFVHATQVEKVVLTGSGDKTIRMWSISDGACLKTFEGHTGSVLRAVFATACSQVLSSGADGLVKLWNVASAECVNTFDVHEDKIWALAAGGTHERLLATGSADAAVVIWEDSTVADTREQVRM